LLHISELLSFIESSDEPIIRDNTIEITDFKPIQKSGLGTITFCSRADELGLKLISNCSASVIICHHKLKTKIKNNSSNLIFVNEPRLWFLRCLKQFFPNPLPSGIHPSAIVECSNIGKNVLIGPFSYISKNVSIGDNTKIFGNVFIYDNVEIGKNVIIHASTVIGSDGFGFEMNEKGVLEKFPHIGGVKIGDDVELGASNCIDRGTLGYTEIGEGTKTDNLVHIAHNVHIGKNCRFAAGVITSGSCIIGDNVYFGTGTVLRDYIEIGDSTFIGVGSVVVKSFSNNSSIMGVPAREFKNLKTKTG
tara:strand:+ start:11045 stop:11959 length:915 start_codon:yes stop_codon:yes gene_type:complete